MMTSLHAKIEELKEYVSLAQYKDIEQWFLDNQNNGLTNRQNKIISQQDFLEEVSLHIRQYVGFFSFKKHSTDVNTIHQETIARENAILKHFEFKEQIDLIASIGVLGQFKEEYLSILNPDLDGEMIYNATSASRLITQLFNQEKFELLEKLETYFRLGILDQKFYQGEVELNENQLKSIFEMQFNEPLFSPYYDIMFNYTQQKEVYLISRNITLPTSEEAHTLINSTLHDDVTDLDDFFVNLYQSRLLEGIQSYCKINNDKEGNSNSNLEQKNKSFKM